MYKGIIKTIHGHKNILNQRVSMSTSMAVSITPVIIINTSSIHTYMHVQEGSSDLKDTDEYKGAKEILQQVTV